MALGTLHMDMTACYLLLAQIAQGTMAPLSHPCCVLASLRGALSAAPESQVFVRALNSWQAVSSSQESLGLILGGSLRETCALRSLDLFS